MLHHWTTRQAQYVLFRENSVYFTSTYQVEKANFYPRNLFIYKCLNLIDVLTSEE